MKIDVLVGENLYGTTAHFAKALAEGLKECGVVVRLFWIGEGHFFHALHEVMADPPDLTLSFSDISMDGRPLGELWHIPHIFWMVDPPIYFLHHLRGHYSWVACVDEGDCAFVKDMGCSKALFLPHGADLGCFKEVNGERPIEKAFFGTCIDYEEVANKWLWRDRELLLAASDRVLSPGGISILQALQELGVGGDDLPRFHAEVDHYTRGKDRVELIRACGENVHIWGEGPWEKYLPRHQVQPQVPFEETVKLMQQSQLVLSSSPRFKQGAHERIFYALMCGAAVYTGANPYLADHLPELLTYQYGEWQQPPLKHFWDTSAEAGQHRVLAHHTWHARAKTLAEFIKTAALRA